MKLLQTLVWFAISMSVMASGCTKPEKLDTDQDSFSQQVEVVAPDPLKVMIVGDDLVGPLIARQWKARRDGEINILDLTLQEFLTSEMKIPDDVDVIFYPPGLLGEMVERELVQELPSEVWNSDELEKNELLKHFRMSISRYSDRAWAVPMGGQTYSMLVDRRVFETAEVDPPKLWEDFDKRLTSIKPHLRSGQILGIDLPLAEGWAANTFLARLAPSIRHRGKLSTVFDRKTMKPLINGPEFVAVLEQIKRIATPRSLTLDPQGVFELVVSGKSAVALTWPTRLDGEFEVADGSVEAIAIRGVPGVQEWFDHESNVWNRRLEEDEINVNYIGFSGLVGSVTETTMNEQTAWEFLQWVPSKTISLLTLNQSPELGPFRATHLGDLSRWTGDVLPIETTDEYADVISNCHQRPLVLMFPRLQKRQQYLVELDRAVREFLNGDRSAQDVLNEVAKKWDAITESVGRTKQVQALRREAGY